MKKTQPATAGSIVRGSVLPFAVLFVVPIFAAWFTWHAEGQYDAKFLQAVSDGVARDASISVSEKPSVISFYERFPPSYVCASDDPGLAEYRASVEESCGEYRQFRLARAVAVGTGAVGALAVLIAIGCALVSFLSRRAQYASFVFGWQSLRVLGASIVAAQAALLTWLSFWMTALWFDIYIPKLILIVAGLAVVALYTIFRSLFATIPDFVDVEGVQIPESRAPELFARVRSICAELGTAPPDQILAGIDDNFFVVEGKVRCGDAEFHGRTLFVSLSLLRILSREEADAILAHEMAHFGSGDTAFSQKLAPALTRFAYFTAVLRENPLSIGVWWFLGAYRALFELSFGKSRREREFAADEASAKLVSKEAAARALVRTNAYASYRTRVERTLFEHDALHDTLALSGRIGAGFLAYAKTSELRNDLVDAVTPHPFDSHPPLAVRIARLGVAMAPEAYEAILTAPVTESWCDAITDAHALEAEQWKAYEARFALQHEIALAHRYKPTTDEERALVEKFFPPRSFQEGVLLLDCKVLRTGTSEDPLQLSEIKKATLQNGGLKLALEGAGMFTRDRVVPLKRLGAEQQAFLDAFTQYWNRARAAERYRAEKALAKPTEGT